MSAVLLKIDTSKPSTNNGNRWLPPQKKSEFVSEYDADLDDLLSLIGEQAWEEACPDGTLIP